MQATLQHPTSQGSGRSEDNEKTASIKVIFHALKEECKVDSELNFPLNQLLTGVSSDVLWRRLESSRFAYFSVRVATSNSDQHGWPLSVWRAGGGGVHTCRVPFGLTHQRILTPVQIPHEINLHPEFCYTSLQSSSRLLCCLLFFCLPLGCTFFHNIFTM